MLSVSQDWALRGIHKNNGYIVASRLGEWMLLRPGFDRSGKTYSPYTLGRMGGAMFMHLKKNGMVRTRKIQGKTVGCLTSAGKRYLHINLDHHSTFPSALAEFVEDFL